MANTIQTTALILGKDKASPAFQSVARSAMLAQKQMSRMNQGVTRAINAQQRLGSGLVGTGAGALGLASFFSGAYQFDKDFRFLGATAEMSTERMEQFRQSLVKVAQQFPKTRLELIRAATEGVTAGLNVSTVENLFKPLTKISMAVREDMGQVMGDITDIVMGANLPFKGETADKQRESFLKVARMMIAGSTMYNQKWSGFVAGMRHAAPVAAALGIEVEKTAVILGHLADAGFKSERGGTALRTIMISLINPTKKAAQSMQRLNLDMNKFLDMDGKKLGIFQTIEKGKLVGGLRHSLQASGIHILEKDVKAFQNLINNPQLQRDVNSYSANVLKFLKLRGYLTDLQDAQIAQQAVTQHALKSSKSFDITGLLMHLKKANPAELAQLVGKRRLPMLIAMINNAHRLTEDQKELVKRMVGIVDRRAEKQMIGFAASTMRLQSAWDALTDSMERSGAIKTISDLLVGKNYDGKGGGPLGGIAGMLEQFGKSSPDLLKWTVLGTTGAVIAGPLALAASAIGAFLSPIVRTGARAAGLMVGLARSAGKFALRLPMLAKNALKTGAALAILKKGLVFGAIGGGLALAAMHIKEIGQFFKGFGSGFMKGWNDQFEFDEFGNIIAVHEGAATRIAKVFKEMFNIDADANTLKAFFEGGQIAGKKFAQTIGSIAEGLQSIVQSLKVIKSYLPSLQTAQNVVVGAGTGIATGFSPSAIADGALDVHKSIVGGLHSLGKSIFGGTPAPAKSPVVDVSKSVVRKQVPSRTGSFAAPGLTGKQTLPAPKTVTNPPASPAERLKRIELQQQINVDVQPSVKGEIEIKLPPGVTADQNIKVGGEAGVSAPKPQVGNHTGAGG